jgi:methylmalonyl-CoA mutase
MTDTVSGGLDEPGGLQPEQGALRLASPEDTGTRADWEHAAAEVLRKTRRLGADDPDDAVWSALTHTTYDGVEVPPLGVRGPHGQVRPERVGAWDVRSYASPGEEQQVNAELLADLAGGATSVWIEVSSREDFATLLHEVHLDLAPVMLSPTDDREATARAFLKHAGHDLHPRTNLGMDPARATREQADLARGAGVLGFVVDGRKVHDWGAGEAQELGWAIATAASYLRSMEEAGLPVDESAALLEFRMAATDEQFLTIAKLRALRRMWARVLELSGAAVTPLRLHAESSARMLTTYDPWVNMVRGTVAAFAAGVGGADAVTTLPFDSRLGRPDAWGRRIARNVSHLLIAESHVASVVDPAGGSYAVERLTDDLASAGWSELGLIEQGGPEAFADRVRAVGERRSDDIARRRRPVTGVSEFPNLTEVLPTREMDVTLDFVPAEAERFELLRADPRAGHVFLATLGPVADHSARAGFAADLLAAGGITVDVAGASAGVDDLTTTYDGQAVVCVAGTDGVYAEWGRQAAAALREAGARRVVVVSSGSTDVGWADDSFRPGDDAIAFLTRTREVLR